MSIPITAAGQQYCTTVTQSNLANSGGGTEPDACFDVTAPVVAVKLELLGTAISTDGKYSEDSTIRVTAMDASCQTVLTGWTGSVSVVEQSEIPIYTQNYPSGSSGLPSSAAVSSGGVATLVAKSLAGPKVSGVDGLPPDDAQIMATNHPVCGGQALAVPQWISSNSEGDPGEIDPRAMGSVYLWFQAWTNDLFNSAADASGDLNTVLSKISTYTLDPTQANQATTFEIWGALQSTVAFNALSNILRTNGDGGSVCAQSRTGFLANTLYHEARHAYQGYLTNSPAGNDADQDWLVNSIPIAPTTIFLDSTDARNVCDEGPIGGYIHGGWVFLGPTVKDWPLEPPPGEPGLGYVSWALEMDAFMFAAAPPR